MDTEEKEITENNNTDTVNPETDETVDSAEVNDVKEGEEADTDADEVQTEKELLMDEKAAKNVSERGKERMRQHEIDMRQDDHNQFMPEQIDPYFEQDPDIGLKNKHYKEPKTLMHGCVHEPQSYKVIPKQELNLCEKLHVTNWMEHVDLVPEQGRFEFVEVRFKNSHKDFFRVPEGLEILEGDVVAVEGTPGHDIGIVSLTGELCRIQIKKKNNFNPDTARRLYRRAKAADIEKWLEVMDKEDETLFRTRKMALDRNLDMKINDVEYQGDGIKAIFYYTADDRVDFRQLIKDLAEAFHIKIEMKQIGARQEASRLGGIGTCGRELCCSTWLNNFSSVSTSVARVQQLFPNPQKLAGQCGKLKCCLNYEYDVYQDALKEFPEIGVSIETEKGTAVYRKTDVLKKIMWYSYKDSSELYALPAKNVRKLIDMNRKNIRPESLEQYTEDGAVSNKGTFISDQTMSLQGPADILPERNDDSRRQPRTDRNRGERGQRNMRPERNSQRGSSSRRLGSRDNGTRNNQRRDSNRNNRNDEKDKE